MTDAEILEVISRAIREETDNPDIVVGPATTAADVPGWDSLAHGRIMLAIEIELGARCNIEDTYAAANVGDLVPLFRAALRQGER
ncbi:MAG: acyl carrier protein [Thiohalocapsa sp.]